MNSQKKLVLLLYNIKKFEIYGIAFQIYPILRITGVTLIYN